ncbi:LuxR C-terminal-related transcriptional regulator [Arthrobacter sp.]|jgi:DNA-binding CsgD family transcriptional regulator|uniref:LuxR C-terminal-related transcriptional regulator n=1 Tax=Arthrobacter sp. TaxID=1667 RepID=UPI00258AD4F1|nr:LuxR C-terminal-related transcriptional regulator [Arthrobacter sp.]
MARRADVDDIVAQLKDSSSRGVLIVGPHGAGKTWMLGRVMDALGSGCTTIRLSPSQALSTVPFGAVNARVGQNLVRSSDFYTVLQGLLDQVEAGVAAGELVFLLVDNGEYLDGQSAAVITQVVMSTEAKLILVDHPGGRDTHLRELWRDGHLARFELAPLKSEDVQNFIGNVLGGGVSIAAADYLSSRSAGNPLVLKGLVAGALEEGSLQQVDGVWVLDHPGDRLGTETRDFLQMDLDQLEPESRRMIEILALAGPLPLDVLLDLTATETIDDIQQRDLVAISPGKVLTMGLSRPATAGPIRQMVPVGRSRRYLADVSKVIAPGPGSGPDMIINFTRWSLDCGMLVDDGQVVVAAAMANHLLRLTDAMQLSSLHVSAQHTAALLAQRSIAHLNRNWTDQARTLATKSLELAPTPDAGAAALRAVHLAYFADLDYASRFSAGLATYEEKFGPVRLTPTSTRPDVDVMILQASKELTLGHVQESSERIQALLAHPLCRGRLDQTLLKSMLCEILSTTGYLTSATKVACEVIAELQSVDGFPRPDIALLAYARAVAAFIYDGAWDRVREGLEPTVFVNPDLMLFAGGLRDLGAAMAHVRLGHIDEALAALRPAVAALINYDPWLVLPSALGLFAYCLALRDDTAGARQRLDQFYAVDRRGSRFYHLEGSAYAAAAEIMTGNDQDGMRRLKEVREECQDLGYTGTELTVLTLLVRMGETSEARRMLDVSESVESAYRDFYREWADALLSGDPAALDEASTTAAAHGFELIAAELATLARRGYADGGKGRGSRKTGAKAVDMRDKLPGLVSPVFRSNDLPQMTRREQEIAQLVAEGESNNSIAEQLGVSLRTVEGHLYRTFIKLDLQSRDQLAALVREGRGANAGAPISSSR